MDNEWIKELKAGDKVIVSHTLRYGAGISESIVQKVTKNFLIVDGNKFNRTTGTSEGFSFSTLYPATAKNVAVIDLAKARHSFVIQAKVVAKSATIEQLQQAAKILGFDV